MSPILRNILAVIAGFILGGIINTGIIILGSTLIPAPEGVDVMDPESMKAGMDLFKPKHYIMPFLAHALGTLTGALIAAKIATKHKLWFALGIGVMFLAGGIYNAFALPAPTWFIVLDLVVAYIPMAWVAALIAKGSQQTWQISP